MGRKRKITQIVSSVLINSNLSGFASGKIYQGKIKSICVPGLNCYSCPGALGSCPLGSLQAAMGSSPIMIPLYVLGFLIVFGMIFGRFICGWLCPFGLIQELLNKIPSRKLEIKSKRALYLKYVILVVFVFAIPIFSFLTYGYVIPAFCKYICPAGTIEAGLPLLLANPGLRKGVGALFGLKALIALAAIVLSVLIFRPFCKYICPLGAIYGMFNKISLIRLEYAGEKCTKCHKCRNVCEMGVCADLQPNSSECIRCGRCIKVCGNDALNFSFLKRN